MSHFFIESSNVVSGPFGSMLKSDAYQATGIPFIRIENIKDGFYINNSDIIYISPADNERIKNSELSQGDIVLSKVGNTIGFFAEVSEDIGVCNISENNIGIKLTGFTDSKKAIILTYLNTHIAKSLTLRRISGNAQPKLNVGDVCEIPIPIFNTEFEKAIEFFLQKSKKNRKDAINSDSVAEQLLLQELGLTDWQPDDEFVATKTFADFQTSGRLDAEYYQPKYQAIAEKLAQYNNGTVSCENVLTNAMTKLTSGTEYCYLELADIGKSGEINSCTHDIAENLPSRARQKVKTNDVIVSSVEGSLASCALITEDYNNAICSTGFHVLRSTEINPETLLLLMKSSPIQALLKQGCSGTILTAILPDALKTIKLPLIRKEVQNELAAKVQESFALRKESKRLLDLAKHAVEIAIEQGEAAAMNLMEENI